MRVHEREATEFEILEHLKLCSFERLLENQRKWGVKDLEITGIENNAGRVAITPLDPHCAGIVKFCHDGRLPSGRPRESGDLSVKTADTVTVVRNSRLRWSERENV